MISIILTYVHILFNVVYHTNKVSLNFGQHHENIIQAYTEAKLTFNKFGDMIKVYFPNSTAVWFFFFK